MINNLRRKALYHYSSGVYRGKGFEFRNPAKIHFCVFMALLFIDPKKEYSSQLHGFV